MIRIIKAIGGYARSAGAQRIHTSATLTNAMKYGIATRFQHDPHISTSLKASDSLIDRHIGPNEKEIQQMLQLLKVSSLEELMKKTLPSNVYDAHALQIDGKDFLHDTPEHLFLQILREMSKKNKINKNYIGAGFYGTIVPGVIQRGVFENPGWYTSYTPYQGEISQGRLESLVNYQTMICELTGLDFANASLLDEGTAAAEALFMTYSLNETKKKALFIAQNCFPQTIEVAKTKASYLGIKVYVDDPETFDFEKHANEISGVLLQVPDTRGEIHDYTELCARIKKLPKVYSIIATDLLASTIVKSPGEMGADIAVGNSQRFGVPMGYGGPHAAFLVTKIEHMRKIPGRVIGVSKDVHGNPAYRMSLQTREQHIRRERATSNICTAQALLANMAAMYAIYHGRDGLKRIGARVHGLAQTTAASLKDLGYNVKTMNFFDTICLQVGESQAIQLMEHFTKHHVNLRRISTSEIGISFDETTTIEDVDHLVKLFASHKTTTAHPHKYYTNPPDALAPSLRREKPFMDQRIFNSIHSEHQMLRYLHYLQAKDVSLTKSMIPLGSCTMKLNASTEMFPVTWPEFSSIHPFTPVDQVKGYGELLHNLTEWLKAVTKFDAFSLQPNSGAQGEYTGTLTIRRYHQARGEGHRNVCLIPISAHGTNPATAAIAGLKIVVIKSDDHGNIDLKDLREKAEENQKNLAMMMVTYPSTHGIYEDTIREAIKIVHDNGGQVYMDGANMNAQVGWTSPGYLGADVCHLNLHKTFAIPHGGGGPGMGPIGVRKHLAPFLPNHPIIKTGGDKALGTVTSTPFGSASILPISYAYIACLGKKGLQKATAVAILAANYIASRLEGHYQILFRGANGFCAHEFIMDIRPLKAETGISEEDVAKRLMDFGFHAPTTSFPVPGTLMVEPTESEDKAELDRLCDALIHIRKEIDMVKTGQYDKLDNPLKNAPHTAEHCLSEKWNHKYTREQAAYPLSWVKQRGKYWPTVGRIDQAYGDRNLICSFKEGSDYFKTV